MSDVNYDYIVVGGGSAGCVLAARLSELPVNRVLLIESGRTDSNPYIHIPATIFKVLEGGRDVQVYASEPDKGLNGRPALIPQGHVIGGGSSVNGMIYIRGQRADYDSWAQMGCRAWSYDRVLAVYRDLEANQRLSNDFHGVSGQLRVSDRAFGHPLSWAFIRAAQEAGLPYNDDFNGAVQEGVGFYQVTSSKGRRWSSARAFLHEAKKRSNLTIMTERRVARIVFEGRKAVGVMLEDGTRIGCNREIALTAGALASPKLLQLSGVGDAEHLRGHGIESVSHVPGVGENYQDHYEATVQGALKDPISLLGQDKGLTGARHMLQYLLTRTGLLTTTIVESGGFVDTTGAGLPDVQFHVLPTFVGFADRPPTPGHGISIGPCVLRPRSRGTVKLRSPNPKDKALFHANALGDPADVDTLMRGVKLAIRIMDSPSLARIVARRVLPEPGLENDAEGLKDYIRSIAKTVFHPAGTCKMGPADDGLAVVDETLKVRGVDGVRVCDASIMPTLVSGNTNAPAIMIAERAARFMTGVEAL